MRSAPASPGQDRHDGPVCSWTLPGEGHSIPGVYRVFSLLLIFAATVFAEDKASIWQGYERLDFQVDGRDCLLVKPKEPAPGKPWIWRTEFFGHEPQGDLALLGH